jgi:hypothetical protein
MEQEVPWGKRVGKTFELKARGGKNTEMKGKL